MEQRRLLVTISFSFSIRYLYRSGLLQKLQEFCTPVIAITWNQADLIEELKKDGFEVHLVPESRWDNDYESLRAQIDSWFYNFQSSSPSRAIQNRYLRQFLPFKTRMRKLAREKYHRFLLSLPGKGTNLFAQEKQLYKTSTNYNQMVDLVKQLNIDAVLTVTPFHRQEDILLRACSDAGKKMITSILSFDNVTKRGWLPVDYEVYMVWNKHNETDLKNIYPSATKKARVMITGAAQFDFYYDPSFLQNKKEWEQQVGLEGNDRKIILYAGGPQQLLPQEPMFLKDLDEAITKGVIPGKPIILFRCHPMDNIERWKKAIGPSENIIYETSWSGTDKLQNANLTRADIVKLCSNLAYTDIHVNVCSTMTVDGSAFNKPQVGPAYDNDNPGIGKLLRTMYQQDHFVPIVKTGGLKMAGSKQELVRLVNDALVNPGKYVVKCNDILKEIITYTDGQCTDRVAGIMKKELEVL